MQLAAPGEALIKSFETLQTHAYKDQGNVWTIGWGHTGKGVGQGLTCTPDAADIWFRADTASAVATVNEAILSLTTQNQFDALVCFVFNIGAANFVHSTMHVLLNTNDPAAADQFDRWIYVKGKISNGLVRRRAAEKALFLQPDLTV